MVIVPPTDNRTPDHPNTPAGATAIELSESFQGRIDSADDVDYFRLRVDSPGTLTIRTTGNGDPDIAVFEGAGEEVQRVSGSWIGRITQEILDRGSDLLVRFSRGNAGGEYTGSATLDQTPQTSPDLVAGSPTVSDSSPETGGAFTLSATVSNQGDGESAATTLRYFRSTDATITTSDTEVGTDAVAGLAPSGSDSRSVDMAAPSAPGTYHYGACVDAVAGESNTANNCSTSVQVQVTVREPEHPDLTVVSPTVSDNRPAPGASFTLSATVRNDGNGESAATTLRYYRSVDGTITTSDTEVGTDAVAGLAASGSDSRSVDMVAPTAPGPYYYGACVDAVAGESNTANNCSTSVQVTVREPEHPDLTVVSPTVSDNRPAPGASFTLSATVRNDGNGESAATTLRYYRSADATITTADTEVGTDAAAGLAASGSDSRTLDMAAPSAPGTYYYGACVEAVAGESNTANNCSTSVQVTVQEPEHPDLMVVSPSVSDNRPAPGASFTLSATVPNDGNGESAATTLRYFRSADATITMSDKSVGTDAVSGLAASVSDSRSVDMAAPSAPGTYYYGACVDAVAGESNTANNCSTAVQIKVLLTARQIQRFPDLVVGTPTASPGRPAAGTAFTLSATVGNTGGATSPSTLLRYYGQPLEGRDDHEVGHAGGHGCGPRACRRGAQQRVDLGDRAVEPRDLLLRRLRGHGERRVGNDEQLLLARDGHESWIGPGGGYAYGERRQPRGRNGLHLVGEGEQHGQCSVAAHDAAVLPLEGRDDHEVGHAGGHGCGWRACRRGAQQRVDLGDRAVEPRDLLLRRLRGRGERRVGNDEQLLLARDGHESWIGPGGGYAYGERRQPRGRNGLHLVGDGEEHGQCSVAAHDAAVLPLAGRDDHEVGHAGGHGCGPRAWRCGDQQRIDLGDCAVEPRDLLLRCLRGRGERRVGNDEQLLLARDGHGTVIQSRIGPGGGYANGERRQPRGRNGLHLVGER